MENSKYNYNNIFLKDQNNQELTSKEEDKNNEINGNIYIQNQNNNSNNDINFAKKLLIQEAIKSILQNIGEDINREGLIKTPERVCKSYSEMFNGYGIDIAKIFEAQFTNENNNKNIILIKKIEYKSMCEHHMLPVIGYANIAYIPNEKVLGLSKFTRIVHAFSNRLQLQERMTKQIIDAIMQYLNPLGVAVHLSAKHYCMIMRGVKQVAEVDTFDFDGIFLEENYQNKFLQLIK